MAVLEPPEGCEKILKSLPRGRWNGNVRKPRNTIGQLPMISPGAVIDSAEGQGVLRRGSSDRTLNVSTNRAETLWEFKELAKRAFLVEKLRESGWSISKKAEAIDTPRSNLYKDIRGVPGYTG